MQSTSLTRLQESFPEEILGTHSRLGEDTAILKPEALARVARFLKQDPQLRFDFLMDLTAVDHWKRKPRFELVYHLYSRSKNVRLRLKAPLGGSSPEAPSVTPLWPAANWYEREVFDMFGIRFRGHPDLRRILMYEEFQGHPLRKDYPIDKRQPLVGPKD
jgi:NADH-quinone oxidoreductase subunit C